ncbi:MAG TPA: hypothetical protein VG929_04160 [Actinomycetota bacterium]|nr:hypothetical protein [Actinomycetota bacterium]
MGTRGRWRAWLGGYALILAAFGLAWWNNPANVGGEREAMRAWLGLGFAAIGMAVFLPPLTVRKDHEVAAQRTLIICLALFMSVALWWVGFLPSDPFGCSRVDAPDCHTNAVTRWRGLAEITVAWMLSFAFTHAAGRALAARRGAKTVS